jgi:hypothetical protein
VMAGEPVEALKREVWLHNKYQGYLRRRTNSVWGEVIHSRSNVETNCRFMIGAICNASRMTSSARKSRRASCIRRSHGWLIRPTSTISGACLPANPSPLDSIDDWFSMAVCPMHVNARSMILNFNGRRRRRSNEFGDSYGDEQATVDGLSG